MQGASFKCSDELNISSTNNGRIAAEADDSGDPCFCNVYTWPEEAQFLFVQLWERRYGRRGFDWYQKVNDTVVLNETNKIYQNGSEPAWQFQYFNDGLLEEDTGVVLGEENIYTINLDIYKIALSFHTEESVEMYCDSRGFINQKPKSSQRDGINEKHDERKDSTFFQTFILIGIAAVFVLIVITTSVHAGLVAYRKPQKQGKTGNSSSTFPGSDVVYVYPTTVDVFIRGNTEANGDYESLVLPEECCNSKTLESSVSNQG